MKKQLNKEAQYIRASLLWHSEKCDLDISAFLLNSKGKARSDADLIFYNNTFSDGKAVVYGGDNRGEQLEMSENILVHLNLIPADISKIVFCVTIHDEDKTLDSAENPQFVANIISDPYDKDGENLCTAPLSGTYSGAVVFELTRSGGGWKYEQMTQSVKGGLTELCSKFGLEVM